MLPHARAEMATLAAGCVVTAHAPVNGWTVDVWHMTAADVSAAVDAYEALLLGSMTASDPVVALLAAEGIDLESLLLDSDESNDDITRSDLTELIAAASMISEDGCTTSRMHMPNVPKMSRRKSDSGIDVFDVALAQPGADELIPSEGLAVASVKHTVLPETKGLRWKLAESLAEDELSQPYMTAQLRVLKGRLEAEGLTHPEASRVFLFLRAFPDPDYVRLFALAVIDPSAMSNMEHHLKLLPDVAKNPCHFRIITCPDLATIHEKCV